MDNIHLISRPLVDITNTEKLQEYVIGPLLEYTVAENIGVRPDQIAALVARSESAE